VLLLATLALPAGADPGADNGAVDDTVVGVSWTGGF